MKKSAIKQTQMKSPLLALTRLRPKGKEKKAPAVASILLTSLVDAFSILVIYLIVNTSTANEIIKDTRGVELPQAQSTLSLEEGVIVKIMDGKYFINEEKVSVRDLIKTLHTVKSEFESKNKKINLIIQADKKDSFAMINPILVSSASTGFERIKFAVIPKGEGNL